MRRALLLSTLSAAGLGALGSVAASPTTGGRKTDRRLLGAWRSDKEKTTALWKYTKEISDENRQKFEAIFGKLTWRITARRWEAEYEDQKWGSPYSVVAASMNNDYKIEKERLASERKRLYDEWEDFLNISSGLMLYQQHLKNETELEEMSAHKKLRRVLLFPMILSSLLSLYAIIWMFKRQRN